MKPKWVVQTRGKYRGRVGLIVSNYSYLKGLEPKLIKTSLVQFGTDGPFEELSVKSLRKAKVEEIPEGVM